ncbi:MAG: DivIVA domain-containing protein [Clostridiales bacterium]|nr:DivIVA domain-containing protein [Clostridiales bacterium]
MTVKDILDKKFGRSFFGYDPQQVDGFLDDIIDKMEALDRERQEMLTAMEYLLKEIERYESSDAPEQQKERGKNRQRSESELNMFRNPRKRTAEEENSGKPEAEPPAPTEKKETPGKPSFLILPEDTNREADLKEEEHGEESLIDQLLREYPPEAGNGGDER